MCIELYPSDATSAQLLSTRAASVEAPYLHHHSSLLTSKAILSSWILVVICALIARERFRLELKLQDGTSSYHELCMNEYIWYVEVPGSPVPYA